MLRRFRRPWGADRRPVADMDWSCAKYGGVMQLFRSRPFMIAIVIFVIIGFVGAGAAALIPRGGSGPASVDAKALWASQPDDVKTEVCTAFRANPQGYILLMEQTWLQDGSLDQPSFDSLVDVIATDCRVNY